MSQNRPLDICNYVWYTDHGGADVDRYEIIIQDVLDWAEEYIKWSEIAAHGRHEDDDAFKAACHNAYASRQELKLAVETYQEMMGGE